VTDEYNQAVSQRAECTEASAASALLAETCASRTAVYEEAFCEHRLSCSMFSQCYAHEAGAYYLLRDEVQATMVARQLQYQTVRQAECIMGLIMSSLQAGATIDDASLTSCDDVSVEDLVISFPTPPPAPEECPVLEIDDPQCDPIPQILEFTNGFAGEDFRPAEGSPDGCECTLVNLEGVYSPGPVVRCNGCLDVHHSTDQNSCPSGWKIFSPRSKADWEVLEASLDGDWPANPHLIIDITRTETGCGGCASPMRSDNPAQSSWTTTDGSPWWLRDGNHREPSGDYHANCYLWVAGTNPEAIHFNDANCYYHSSDYLCQPETAQPPVPEPAAGSPPGCQCREVALQDSYSAGQVVRCDGCLDVHHSTDQNSCPSGMKIFSPRSKADWEVLEASLVGDWPASPHLIVDITRNENGCGGCASAMNSDNSAQSSWTTTDGSPWWLRDSNFGEPNGDYHANCYLNVHGTNNPEALYFNDGRCLYHSSSYLCQTEA